MTDANPSVTLPSLPPRAPSPPHAPTFARIHLWLYRVSGGRIAGKLRPRRFLILTTTGRRSGARYAIPLEYHTDGATPYLIASNFGHDYPPAWLLNAQANPRVEIERDGRRQWATASIASPADRQRLWPELVRVAPHYARYQQGTSREIPLVLLRPLS
jgi:F420H(2)-dependent quinone reductase